MPKAVARKLEFILRNEGLDFDVKLNPIVLTYEHVMQYKLPRTPARSGHVWRRVSPN